jgi:phosphoglycolate phosphatase
MITTGTGSLPFQLAIFDFDGTLANSFAWFLSIVNQTADRFGFRHIDETNIESLRGLDARQVIRQLEMPIWKMPLVARHMRRQMAGDISSVILYPGIGAMLQQLDARGVQLAVVTSNSIENVRRVLGAEYSSLIRYFGCGASLFGKRRKFQQILRHSGISPSQAISIGDELRDLNASRAASIPFGAVTWGYTTAKALEEANPEEIFSSVEDIIQKLTPWPSR